jgi:hypothetical protein
MPDADRRRQHRRSTRRVGSYAARCASADLDVARLQPQGLGQRSLDPLRDRACLAGLLEVGAEHDELVTTEPADEIRCGQVAERLGRVVSDQRAVRQADQRVVLGARTPGAMPAGPR